MNVRVLLLAAVCTVALMGGAESPAWGSAPSATPADRRSAPRWSWPVTAAHRVVTPFDAPSEVWSPGHRGVDLAIEQPTVLAPADGTVHFSGVVVDRPVLSIDHGDGVLSSFEPVMSDLRKGDPVSRGEQVGSIAAGHCRDDECVHIGARIDGVYVSPLLLLGGSPSVLLPTRPLR